MGDQQDIEEECEEAVFAVCDARERYSMRCAEELDKYLNVKTNIAMKPVVLKMSPEIFEIPPTPDIGEKEGETPKVGGNTRRTWHNGAEQLQHMINKIQQLKVALKQLEDNKNFEIKHHLK